MSQQQIKIFMPEEANRALSLVRQIVRDILYNQFQINTIISSYGPNKEELKQNSEIQKYYDEIKAFNKELDEIGCYFREFSSSVCLVDFPAIIDGEEVYLCWRSNEESVRFYHSLDGGYKMRKPIPDYYYQNSFERQV